MNNKFARDQFVYKIVDVVQGDAKVILGLDMDLYQGQDILFDLGFKRVQPFKNLKHDKIEAIFEREDQEYEYGGRMGGDVVWFNIKQEK